VILFSSPTGMRIEDGWKVCINNRALSIIINSPQMNTDKKDSRIVFWDVYPAIDVYPRSSVAKDLNYPPGS
jgi:hypothetical protein